MVFKAKRRYFLCVDLACRRPYFSLLRQRKVSKRKASQRPWPLQGCLALLAVRGVGRKLATLKQAPALIRAPLRCSARPMAQGARIPRVLVRCAHLAHAWTRQCALGARAQKLPLALAPNNAVPAPHPHQAPIHQLRQHRSPIEANKPGSQPLAPKPLSGLIKPNWVFKLPFTPRGGEGAGGKRGKKNYSKKLHPTKPQSINYDSPISQRRPPNPHRNLPHQHPSPAQNNQIGCSSSPSPRRG
jgi:hypothetical protein